MQCFHAAGMTQLLTFYVSCNVYYINTLPTTRFSGRSVRFPEVSKREEKELV